MSRPTASKHLGHAHRKRPRCRWRTHGMTTAGDLGLGRMVSTRKEFIRRLLAEREGLIDPGRADWHETGRRLYASACRSAFHRSLRGFCGCQVRQCGIFCAGWFRLICTRAPFRLAMWRPLRAATWLPLFGDWKTRAPARPSLNWRIHVAFEHVLVLEVAILTA
jgi:hypothetical protein